MKKLVIKSIKNSSDLKILDASGKPGDALDNHKINQKAIILMRSGSIIYKEGNKIIPLSAGDSHDIPKGVFHKVTCTTNAKFFVIMPSDTKMKFDL